MAASGTYWNRVSDSGLGQKSYGDPIGRSNAGISETSPEMHHARGCHVRLTPQQLAEPIRQLVREALNGRRDAPGRPTRPGRSAGVKTWTPAITPWLIIIVVGEQREPVDIGAGRVCVHGPRVTSV